MADQLFTQHRVQAPYPIVLARDALDFLERELDAEEGGREDAAGLYGYWSSRAELVIEAAAPISGEFRSRNNPDIRAEKAYEMEADFTAPGGPGWVWCGDAHSHTNGRDVPSPGDLSSWAASAAASRERSEGFYAGILVMPPVPGGIKPILHAWLADCRATGRVVIAPADLILPPVEFGRVA